MILFACLLLITTHKVQLQSQNHGMAPAGFPIPTPRGMPNPPPRVPPHLLQRLPVGGELPGAAGGSCPRRHVGPFRPGARRRFPAASPDLLLPPPPPPALPLGRGARPRRLGLRGALLRHAAGAGGGGGNQSQTDRGYRFTATPGTGPRSAAPARRGTSTRSSVPGCGARRVCEAAAYPRCEGPAAGVGLGRCRGGGVRPVRAEVERHGAPFPHRPACVWPLRLAPSSLLPRFLAAVKSQTLRKKPLSLQLFQ